MSNKKDNNTMKKIILLLLCIAFALSSCKQDCTCTCHLRDDINGIDDSVYYVIHDTQGQATIQCHSGNYTSQFLGYTKSLDCTLE